MAKKISEAFTDNPVTIVQTGNLLPMAVSDLNGAYLAQDNAADIDAVQKYVGEIAVAGATTVGIAGTYTNGPNSDGIGATFQLTSTAVPTIDGQSYNQVGMTPDCGLLFKNQGSGAGNVIQNGPYYLSQVANPGVTGAIFTRYPNFNNINNVTEGKTVKVVGGTTQGGTDWYVNLAGPFNVGSDPIPFSKTNTSDPTKLPLTGGTLSGNLLLGNFSDLAFLNSTNDLNNFLTYQMYAYNSDPGPYALQLVSVESGVVKQLYTIFQDDPGVPGQVKYVWPFPKVSRNISMNDQGVWTGAQPCLPVSLTSNLNHIAIDAYAGNLFQTTLTENTTIDAPSNSTEGMTIQIWIKQDASSSYTVALNAIFVPNANSPSFSMSPTLNSVVCITATYLFSQWNYSFV